MLFEIRGSSGCKFTEEKPEFSREFFSLFNLTQSCFRTLSDIYDGAFENIYGQAFGNIHDGVFKLFQGKS